MRYAISQEDVESANLALEDATGMGASAEDSSDLSIFLGEKTFASHQHHQELKQAEEKISALRLKLDPEGEARRRRVEARKSQGTEKKWNFSGKSSLAHGE